MKRITMNVDSRIRCITKNGYDEWKEYIRYFEKIFCYLLYGGFLCWIYRWPFRENLGRDLVNAAFSLMLQRKAQLFWVQSTALGLPWCQQKFLRVMSVIFAYFSRQILTGAFVFIFIFRLTIYLTFNMYYIIR